MSEVKRYHVGDTGLVEGTALGRPSVVLAADFDRVTAERDALQLRLTVADQRNDDLDGLLRAWYEANAKRLIRVDDAAYHIVTSTAEVLEGKPASAKRAVLLTMDREMRVYIAGPMTGIPEYNFPAFNAMAEKLRGAGWHVENPADHGHVVGAEWADYLRYDIGRLATCEVVMLLPGWTSSRGARLEVSIARELGIGLMYADGAEYKPTSKPLAADEIPDFSPGNGNKARRRAEALKPTESGAGE
ncbi:DUF4406 domain-containing protein [Pseudomonas sp. UMAB-40]|uniref:DUF4406 domain-containing protein n=1 Tax=Pseudomonas sp. UMAB-40 TaxID=1365407 RepID=UPI00214CC75A|nr:DUF4406 domain-containing protein [Pseudomonas sp. UMAB-40]